MTVPWALCHWLLLICVLGGIALAALAIPPIATHFCVAWSVVCHIRAPCLNRSTNLHAKWQVHLRGHPKATLYQMGLGNGVPDPQRRGDFCRRTPQLHHAISNCCCHLANRNEERLGLRRSLNHFGTCYLLSPEEEGSYVLLQIYTCLSVRNVWTNLIFRGT